MLLSVARTLFLLSALYPLWLTRRIKRLIGLVGKGPPPVGAVEDLTLTPDRLGEVLDRDRPAVLRGFLHQYDFTRVLQPEVMKQMWGERRTVSYRAARDQKGFCQEESRAEPINYGELIDLIFGAHDPSFRYYSRAGGDRRALEELKTANVPHPFSHYDIWIGEDENITPFHCDFWHSFLGQTYGNKHVMLVPPEDAPCLRLKTFPLSRDANLRGACDLPDDVRGHERRDPRYASARRLEVILRPGDFLYIPPSWWHWVVTLSPSVSVLMRYDRPASDIFKTPEIIHQTWRGLLASIGYAPGSPRPPLRMMDIWGGPDTELARRLEAVRDQRAGLPAGAAGGTG